MSSLKLAKVESAGLSFMDRGMLTINITVKYEEGCCQNICGFVLDSPVTGQMGGNITHPDGTSSYRQGCKEGLEFIRRVLQVFQIDDLHLLKGKHMWVIGEGEGLSFKPTGFKPLSVDNHRKGMIDYKEIFGE